MEKYIVYFFFKGKEEFQLTECFVSKEGDPIRYKFLIDPAIERWSVDHKTQINASEITNIKVFNGERELIAEQLKWADTTTITECSI